MIKENEIIRINGTDYEAMTLSLLKEADLSGLIGDRQLRIGIKPNVLGCIPAEFGATTHTEIVSAIISYLLDEGYMDITVLEGAWVGDRTEKAFEYCGYNRIKEKYPIRLFDTQKDTSHKTDCGDGMQIAVCDVVDEIDFLINVPVLKGHCQTRMTCAMKNLKGLIPNSEKRRFHTIGLHKPIAYLQKAIRQDFIVVDNICGDLDFEEGGNPVVTNCILAAVDPVLVDSYACRATGHEPDDVEYVSLAASIGIGSMDIDSAIIRNIGPKGISAAKPLHAQKRTGILDVSYSTEEVDSCSACYAALTAALLRLKDEELLEMLQEKISIGQGFKGKKGRLGVGNCTKAFDYSIPGCPPKEEDIYEGLKKYIQQNFLE